MSPSTHTSESAPAAALMQRTVSAPAHAAAARDPCDYLLDPKSALWARRDPGAELGYGCVDWFLYGAEAATGAPAPLPRSE